MSADKLDEIARRLYRKLYRSIPTDSDDAKLDPIRAALDEAYRAAVIQAEAKLVSTHRAALKNGEALLLTEAKLAETQGELESREMQCAALSADSIKWQDALAAERARIEKLTEERAQLADTHRLRREALIRRVKAAEARTAKLVEAAQDLADAGLEFSDERVSYETWQVDRGAMEVLRAALAAAKASEEKP